MRRTIWLRIAASAGTLLASGCGSSAHAAAEKTVEHRNQATVVVHAVRQTLADYIRRDLRAFCSDFTPAVAAHLVNGEGTCVSGLAPAFHPRPGQGEIYAPNERPNGLRISHVRWHGDIAHLTSTWPWPNIRKPVNLTLQKLNGRWVIATPTHVVEEPLCTHPLGKLNCATFYGVWFGVHVPSRIVTIEPKQP